MYCLYRFYTIAVDAFFIKLFMAIECFQIFVKSEFLKQCYQDMDEERVFIQGKLLKKEDKTII